jgi:hypothetical protein
LNNETIWYLTEYISNYIDIKTQNETGFGQIENATHSCEGAGRYLTELSRALGANASLMAIES